jgi:hypothetical protein
MREPPIQNSSCFILLQEYRGQSYACLLTKVISGAYFVEGYSKEGLLDNGTLNLLRNFGPTMASAFQIQAHLFVLFAADLPARIACFQKL